MPPKKKKATKAAKKAAPAQAALRAAGSAGRSILFGKKAATIVVLILIIASLAVILGGNQGTVTYSGAGLGSYPSLQAAIDGTPAGGTILLKRGTYSEQLVIKKAINIIGEDRNSVIIAGSGNKNLTNIGISIEANGVVIDGVCVKNFGIGIYVNAGSNRTRITNSALTNVTRGVSIFGDDTEVSNSVFTIIGQYGIYAATSRNNRITNNIITNATRNTHQGIYILGNEGTTVANNNLSNGATGIYCVESTINITSNIIDNYTIGIYNLMVHSAFSKNIIKNFAIGIELDGSTNCKITGNSIKAGAKTASSGMTTVPTIGVYLKAFSKIDYTNEANTISGNILSDNGAGVKLHGMNEGNTVSGNMIEKNEAGITFEDLYDSYQYYRVNKGNAISGNTITSNGIGINFIVTANQPGLVLTSYNRGNTISGNNIMKNTNGGIEALDEKMIISAQSNYWGSASGPNALLKPLSDGDHVTANVDFRNYQSTEQKIPTINVTMPIIANAPITRNFEGGSAGGAAYWIAAILMAAAVVVAIVVIYRRYAKK